ncbi:MAG: sulfatase-like hydrolase/transferase [Bacillota bacterium]
MRKQPNIILVNCDDLGYGDLGCYGSVNNDTPNIDRLAADGMRFTDFYMASPVCSPSRAAMMTGCYPPRISFGDLDGDIVLFPGQDIGLHPDEITIADLLKQSGYATMHVGKWHCGDQDEFLPTSHGFDDYYGIPFSNDMGRMIGRETTPPLPLLHGRQVIQEQPDLTSITERYAEKSVEFIRANSGRPFFLYLAHMHVHLPLYAAPMFVERSRNGDYGACVMAIDWAMGVIVNELEKCGLFEDTLIIFTSDNGSRNDRGDSNGKLRGNKATTWEGGMRVPFIVHWPGHVRPSVNTEIVASMDLYPTLARIAGVEIPTDRITDGLDITDLLLSNAEKSPRDTVFYYMMNKLEAVRVGDYKLFVSRPPQKEINVAENGTLDLYVMMDEEEGKTKNRAGVAASETVYELYNLREDIGETTNIYAEHPDIVARLMEKIDACRQDMGDSVTGVAGKSVRPIGRVQNPRPLTQYDENHPYIIALYDRNEIG